MKKYKQKMLFLIMRIKWKITNTDNSTWPGRLFEMKNVKIGKHTYGEINAITYPCDGSLLRIGSFCSITSATTFLLGGEHIINNISTFPFKEHVVGSGIDTLSKGAIIVSDDVWIGYGAIVLSGVHIGQGAVVAAGAVVTKDVPPYAVVGGIPAKVIKYRFEQPVIDYMLTLDYSALSEDLIREHVDDLYTEIDGMELDEVKKLFDWFPKKS